jgi:hypothetical protein
VLHLLLGEVLLDDSALRLDEHDGVLLVLHLLLGEVLLGAVAREGNALFSDCSGDRMGPEARTSYTHFLSLGTVRQNTRRHVVLVYSSGLHDIQG